MFKILFYTDSHYTARNPASRKDTLFETSINKTKEVFEIGKEHDVDLFLHAGDFFDSPDISDNVAGIIGSLYLTAPKKVIVIPGNHDIRGNNIGTLDGTKLGLLGKLNIVRVLNYGEKIFIEKDGLKIQVSGSPADFGINRNKEMFILREKNADIAIHMAHAMILRDDAKFGDYVPVNEIQDETLADITLSGDFHLGFETVYQGGKYFVNPGALVRKYNFVEEIQRTVQVALITIHDDKSIAIDMIPLKSAKPGQDVLDREKMIKQREYSQQLLNFTNSLSIKHSIIDDIVDVIMFIAREDNIEDDVLQEILSRLDDVKKRLGIIG